MPPDQQTFNYRQPISQHALLSCLLSLQSSQLLVGLCLDGGQGNTIVINTGNAGV